MDETGTGQQWPLSLKTKLLLLLLFITFPPNFAVCFVSFLVYLPLPSQTHTLYSEKLKEVREL
jgi:hypothetical protein